jgi:hypothetical protein
MIEGLYPSQYRTSTDPIVIHTLPMDVDPLHSNKLFVQCPQLDRYRQDAKLTPLWNHFVSRFSLQISLALALAPLKTDLRQNRKAIPPQAENIWCRECWGKSQPCVDQQSLCNHGDIDPEIREMLCTNSKHRIWRNNTNETCLPSFLVNDLWLFKSFDFWHTHNYYPREYQPEQLRLEMGPLFREILTNFNSSAVSLPSSDSNLPKAHFYFTHDGTMSGLLGALNAAPEHHTWPAYRSNLVIEIWESEIQGDHVRILHDGQPFRIDPTLPIVGCQFGGKLCPVSEFIQFLQQRSVNDWDRACML